MSSWHSYSSIYNLGHKAIADLLTVPVIVEEKVDGSQFSFGRFGTELRIRSKGQEMPIDAPEKMFAKAASSVRDLYDLLHDGWTYRGEYLQKPHHNGLTYDRVPAKHIILFDINDGEQSFLSAIDRAAEGRRVGLEVVPVLWEGPGSGLSIDRLKQLLETPSVLGGQKIEGVVIKPFDYGLFGLDHKVLMGKHVSEAFKEVQKKAWKESNPKSGDILDRLIATYKTPARWAKAVQHLKEAGQLEDSPRDIGKLIKEVPSDVLAECKDEIADQLWKWAWPHVARGVTGGLPEWYKDRLLERFVEQEFGPHQNPGSQEPENVAQ